MTKIDTLDTFMNAVRKNCDISDASGSAIFSICGMALRLRDLNKWEKKFHPWQENDPEALVAWIDQKETLWETIEGSPFVSLPLSGRTFDPFDTMAINDILSPLNLFYGAGYAHSLKPTFFVAKTQKTLSIKDIPLKILGKELLRDVLTIPALNQDNTVLIRRDAAGLYLWDQMVYLKKSGQRFLHFALRQCGLTDTDLETRKAHFEKILSIQEQTYIFHEIGEITDPIFDHDIFRQIVSSFPHTPVELLVRTVKDLLADTGPLGTLQQMISTKNSAGLGFYAAFQDGLFRPLYPQLRFSVEKFVAHRDWESIEDIRQTGFKTATQYARDLMEIYCEAKDRDDMDHGAQKINKTLVKPLVG